MPIPSESLETPEIVWATPDEILERVRDKLDSPRIKKKRRACVLVRAYDGRYAATSVFDIQALVREQGSSLLARPLRELGLLHLHAGVEQDSIDETQARQLAQQYGGYLVVLRGGGYVGLVKGASQTGHGLQGPDDFDLFDELLPRSVLKETEFIVAPAHSPVTAVARELKTLNDPRNAFVIVVMDDDSYRVIVASELNAEVTPAAGDPGLWLAPLERFPLLLRTAASREFRTVGQEQAQNLVRDNDFLILTEDGEPIGLMASKDIKRDAGPDPTTISIEKGPAFNLFEILEATLDDIEASLQEEMEETVEVGPGPVPPEETVKVAPEPEPPADADPRFVNIWFADSHGEPGARSQPLELRRSYLLKLNIGELGEESIIEGHQPPIHEPSREAGKDTNLTVALFWDRSEFDVPNPTQSLKLPPAGDSRPVEFEITPLRPSLGPEDKLALDAHIYYRCNVVQSWRVRVEVVPQGQGPQSDLPQEPVLLADRTKDYVALEDIGPRHLSLTIDRAPAGGYWVDLFVAGEDSEADEVRLSCRVNLRREDLTHLITKARRQLTNITRAPVYREEQVDDEPTRKKALSALALLGRQMYHRLFELEGDDGSAIQVGTWITENLKPGSTLQVIDRARDFVFPWSLIYDKVPWDRGGLAQGVEVDGFWGYRYMIELLTPDLVQTHLDKGVEVDASDGLRVGVGLNTQIPWSGKQRGFFQELDAQCGERADYVLIEESTQLTDFLENGNQHLFYLFCHGFTERMASDIQVGGDLIGEARAFWNSLPAEQRERYKDQADDLFVVSDSWIKLTYGTIPLTMMEHYAAQKLAYAPLVFLNMCESAQVLPSLSGGFIPFFLRHGARAVIGTECPMTSTFADPFARSFFYRFLGGQPLGQILWELRRDYLNGGNPLGLAYTLYGDANTKLSESILRPSSEKETDMPNQTLEQQVNRLWLQPEDDLYTTLGINQQAVMTARKNHDAAQLELAGHYDTVFSATDTEMGALDDLKAFGKMWWAELEPKVFDLLCNRENPEHDVLMEALTEGAKMLAIALVPALVAQVATLPAVAIIIATIAAKKVADAGLEAACKLWAESIEEEEGD